jgi:hypothetical protein
MVRSTLHDALLFVRWMDTDNYWKNTRPMYNKTLPLLVRYAFPQRLECYARQRLSQYSTLKDSKGDTEILIQTTDCYTALQSKLENPFFFGKE